MEPEARPAPSTSGPYGPPPADATAGLPPDGLLLHAFALPLLQQLQRWHQENVGQGRRRPLIGLNGPVGAGKSTLGRQLEALAPRFGLRLVVASIDDLYLSWPERGERLAGNPFGVSRVPPGSHDVPLLLEALHRWRSGERLRLPRFDKTLAHGQGDRAGWRLEACDAVVLEGWLLGCRPLAASDLAVVMQAAAARASEGTHGSGAGPGPGDPLWSGQGAPVLHPQEWQWLPHWNRELELYQPLWSACDGLWVLRPEHWGLPRRWRFQAEARQRRHGGGWLSAGALDALVRASLCSLPPSLYQDPLLKTLPAEARPDPGGAKQGWSSLSPGPSLTAGDGGPSGAMEWGRGDRLAGTRPDRAGSDRSDPEEDHRTRGISCDAPGRELSIRNDRPSGREWARGQEGTAPLPATYGKNIAPEDEATRSESCLDGAPRSPLLAGVEAWEAPQVASTDPTPQHFSPGGQGSDVAAGTGTMGDPDPECGPPVQAVAWLDGRRRCLRVWRQPSASLSSSATG